MSDRIVVCVGYPDMQSEEHLARLRAIDPRIEAIALPVDSDGVWITVPPKEPHPEPPPWAAGVAQERRAALARAEVLIALHTPIDLMELAPRLRWVHGVGAGVEQFAAAGLRREHVVLTNSSGLSSASMAEFVIGRLLQIWKRFPEQWEHQVAHRYEQTYGRTFAGSVIGIVGLGNIGSAVAMRARALSAKVLAIRRSYRPGSSSEFADELFGPESLHEVLGRCDAVVVCAPATDETRHLFAAAAFSAMRRGSTLVNVARGSLVDEKALADALRSGALAAAALDVFEREPLPAESPLWDLPGCLVSAHSSVSVDRYIDDVFDLFVENLRLYTAGDPLRNVVDLQALGFA